MQHDNGNIFSFQRLKIWQKSILFAKKVIRIVDGLNTNRKHYRLIEQLESASTSVAWINMKILQEIQNDAEEITKMLNSLVKSMK